MDDLAFERATGRQHGHEEVSEKIGTHEQRLSNDTVRRTFLLFLNLCQQYFVRIYVKSGNIAESLANRKIFKRNGGAAHEAEETQPKGKPYALDYLRCYFDCLASRRLHCPIWRQFDSPSPSDRGGHPDYQSDLWPTRGVSAVSR